jgi:hypothetical protein
MDLGSEFRLFCLALRLRPRADDLRAEEAAELRRLAAAGPRWDTLVRGARRHRVAAAVLRGLQACGTPHLPDAVAKRLRKLSLANARRSLAQVAEVRRLAQLFAAAGVRVLVLKGATLAAQLYGDEGARVARDIDLLVDPDQFARAQEVLAAAGYRQRPDLRSPRQYAAYLRSIKDLEYVHAASGNLVELHHRLLANPNLLSVPFGVLWDEREEVELSGGVVATMSRQRLPLYLCAHGADHGWARLHWLVDFAAAMRQADGARVIAEADAAGLGPALRHALMLAHDWLGLTIAPAAPARAADVARVRHLQFVFRRLYTAANWHDATPKRALVYAVWERLYRLLLKSDWRYRADQLRADWFCPADWQSVPLPERLFWLYPLVRPWGWLIRRRSLPWRKAPPLTAPSLTAPSLAAPSPPARGSAS